MSGDEQNEQNEQNEKTAADVKVRPAGDSDASAIHVLAGELAATVGDEAPSGAEIRTRLRELVAGESSGVLVAVVAGEVVGVVSYWLKPDLAHGDRVAEIPMLAVSSGHRRGGVGRALLAAVIERASGAAIIELVTMPTNVTAREFYRSLGFVETDHLVLEFFGEARDS